MRCAHCGTDNTYKDRSLSGTCKGCSRKFVFEPKRGDPVTDVMFKNAIEAVSAGGRIRWGVEHLYYEICRRIRRNNKPLVALLIPAIMATIGVVFLNLPGGSSGTPRLIGMGLLGIAMLILLVILTKLFQSKYVHPNLC